MSGVPPARFAALAPVVAFLRRAAPLGVVLALVFCGPTLGALYPVWIVVAYVPLIFISLPRARISSRALAFACAALAAAGAAFVFAPFYFSDDSVRHIHEGFYLRLGIDVYSTPPLVLPPILETPPNYAWVGSVYFPATQALAWVGAGLSPRYGFLALYNGAVLLALGVALARFRPAQRRFWASRALAPIVWITFASRHADLLGLVLVLAALSLLPESAAGVSPGVRRGWRAGAKLLAVGFFAAWLPGLKPEGLPWFLYLAWRAAGFATDATARERRREHASAAALFCLGAAGPLIFQVAFAAHALWPTDAAQTAFARTVRDFADWFLAYNPILDFREAFLGALRPDDLRIHRAQVAAVGGLVLCLAPAVWLLRRNPQRFEGRRLRRLERIRAPRMAAFALLTALAVLTLSRGAWNPWYFLWMLPALRLAGMHGAELWLARGLPLWYIPIFWLRYDGAWDMALFYWIAGGYFLLGFLLTNAKTIRSLCVWSRKARRTARNSNSC